MTAAAIVYYLVMRHRNGVKDYPLDGSRATLPGRVLVCTPSNVSADEICVRIAATGVKVVRLMAASREDQKSPIDELCVHVRARNILMERDAEFRRIQTMWENDDSMLTEREDRARYRAMKQKKEEVLEGAEVVVCTCDTAGCSLLADKLFNTVLIDEVSQSTEPEALVPVVHGAERVVLVGDHKQLAPVIISLPVKKAGMERSVFERLVRQGEAPVLLDTQYRMHPAISYYPSETFYDGKIRDGITAAKRPVLEAVHYSNPLRPVQFIRVVGREETSSEGSSYLNLEEAVYTVRLVQYLTQIGVKPRQIGVLSSYKGQKKLLAKSLAKVGLEEVECESVNTFQGREKDYIIYSCVRSNDRNAIGFSSDMKRLNVVLTRAKFGLFLIGNPVCMCGDVNWMNYIKYNFENMQVVEGQPGKWTVVKELWSVCCKQEKGTPHHYRCRPRWSRFPSCLACPCSPFPCWTHSPSSCSVPGCSPPSSWTPPSTACSARTGSASAAPSSSSGPSPSSPDPSPRPPALRLPSSSLPFTPCIHYYSCHDSPLPPPFPSGCASAPCSPRTRFAPRRRTRSSANTA